MPNCQNKWQQFSRRFSPCMYKGLDAIMPNALPEARATLLIVDDTPHNLVILGELLSPLYNIRVANSGQRALACVSLDPKPDLILLDIMMPDMNGYQVLEQLKADIVYSSIPVIFVSALGEDEDETKGLRLGAADYIHKPVRPAIVLARVQTQLELKAARDRMREQNVWLDHEVKRRMQQNIMIQGVALRSLASLAEARDTDTGNHILRTQGYVNLLALELATLPHYSQRLTPEIIERITRAAPLHDIGKVGIPDAILHKPGSLNPEEWVIMKTHAQIGAESIWRAIQFESDHQGLDFMYTAMEIAGSHHEKWDGSGYPQGLAGDAIPLSAQLMALADVFDALISRRVYKPPFSVDETVRLVLAGKDSHFAPDIVDAFVRRQDEFVEIAMRYQDPGAEHP